ncbi:MAG: glycosyltransferase [Ornithinimicrobium sp.]|uniref:glycosyltransferase n=1 Tax=Ornithinimicrobium sp. TaxID=1977084 RepID=UPI0026DF4530|nr:glycosyltransferase [Ornithinimicrobium sp.]MDO5739142.1 glycosyltransferase [Ornithinimicrobium sp.]
MDHHFHATTQGVAADHAKVAARRPRALVSTALRTKSRYAREILAEVAWPGHGPAELEAWAADPAHRLPPTDSDARAVADYAKVLALQLEGEFRNARLMLDQLSRAAEWATLPRDKVELLAQLRLLDGDVNGALHLVGDERVRRGVAASIRADALHPRLAGDTDRADWASAFSRALHSQRLAPFEAPARDKMPNLDDLRVEHRPAVESPLRVTVIMSTFRPGPSLLTAVSSVLAQTWANLELFVVDDASGPHDGGAWDELLDRVEAMDERVTLIRKAVNGGTYRARNTVLRQASGDLAIVIDSDDWWHPQTLEVCVEPLVNDPGLLATRAQGVRVTPDLVLTRPGYDPRFPSAATVLFRLRRVVSRIGFFDPTRKGADTEFTRRLVASFGQVVLDIEETTTILRAGDGTLSAEEFSHGWRHPARHQYKSMYSQWHQQISRGESDPYLDPDLPRRFLEPRRWSRAVEPLLAAPAHFHLCLAGDWRRDGGPQRSMLEEIRAAREGGLRVAVMHLEALRFMTNKDQVLCAPLLELIQAREVEWIHADDDVDIDVLMIRYPPILQYPPYLTRSVRAANVLVMANQGPLELDGSDQRYVVRDVSARTQETFGVTPRWVPQSPTIRRILQQEDAEVSLTDWDSPGLIDVDSWSVRPTGHPGADGRPIVVGRHSRDDRIKFPGSFEDLLRGYSFPDSYRVRMLGAAHTVSRLRQENGRSAPPIPPAWEILPHRDEDVREFLSGLDFFLYLDNPDAHEAFGRTLLEAAASGVLVIAHPKHRPTFGDALDYAKPGEAQALIAAYVSDPQGYAARVESTRAAVRERYGHQGFVHKLARMLSSRAGAIKSEAPVQEASMADVRLTFSCGGVVRLQAGSGVDVERLVLRSAADAERADGAVILHHGLTPETIRPWLLGGLAGISEPSWSPARLVCTAPEGVLAVLLDRDGLTLAAGRGAWEGHAEDEELCRLAGAEVQEGWSTLAWWSARPPRELVLRQVKPPQSSSTCSSGASRSTRA